MIRKEVGLCFKSNAIATNYFTTFLQNVDMTDLLLVSIETYH